MTDLPSLLQESLAQEVAHCSLHQLQKAAAELTERYRQPEKRQVVTANRDLFISSVPQALAYLTTRMPATYSVIRRVLEEVQQLLPTLTVTSLLDLGAGPGTATWAALEQFPHLQKALLIEQDEKLIAIGKNLMKNHPALARIEWLKDNMCQTPLTQTEMIILSYSLGEIPLDQLEKLIERCWLATQFLLICIEPGTTHGFNRLLQARNYLIAQGAHILAPCPHHFTCPLAKQGDWCHFAKRLPRSSLHRLTKEADKGFEDEKYSYLICTRQAIPSYEARIVRHPQIHSGHLNLKVCNKQGEALELTLSRRHGALYKQARKLDWGDRLD